MNDVNATPSFREQLTISSSLDMLEEVYRWTNFHLECIGITDTKKYEIVLAVSEAVTNAIRHGNHEDPESFVVIVFESHENEIVITVQDEGPGFDPDILPDPTRGEKLFTPSGRGVFLLRSLADEINFEFTSDGTILKVRFFA